MFPTTDLCTVSVVGGRVGFGFKVVQPCRDVAESWAGLEGRSGGVTEWLVSKSVSMFESMSESESKSASEDEADFESWVGWGVSILRFLAFLILAGDSCFSMQRFLVESLFLATELIRKWIMTMFVRFSVVQLLQYGQARSELSNRYSFRWEQEHGLLRVCTTPHLEHCMVVERNNVWAEAVIRKWEKKTEEGRERVKKRNRENESAGMQ